MVTNVSNLWTSVDLSHVPGAPRTAAAAANDAAECLRQIGGATVARGLTPKTIS